MRLSGQESQKLRDALIDAFPNSEYLKQMLWFELDINLSAIASEGSLQDIVFNLIQRANSEGWVENLVRAARNSNPRNPLLRDIAQELLNSEIFSSPNISQKQSIEQIKSLPVLSTVINWIQNIWRELTSSFPTQYCESIIDTYDDFQTQGLDRDFPLELQKLFIPLKIAAKQTANVRSEMIPQLDDKANNINEHVIWNFLTPTDNGQTSPRLVVLGAPGSGKTTLLKHITLIYATNQLKGALALIPVLLYLKDIRQKIVADSPLLANLITEQVKTLNPPTYWFDKKLHEKKCLVMLDGLDEVADEKERQHVSCWVDEQIKKYPDTTFILTSRPGGYKAAPLTQAVLVLEVQPFNLQQIQEFIDNWYLETERITRPKIEESQIRKDAKERADRLIQSIRNNPSLAAMAVNPLLLTMIATVHRRTGSLPEKRVELYKEICEVVLEKRRREKKITDNLTGKNKQSVLQVLALKLMRQKVREFKLSDGISWIQEQLISVVSNQVKPEEFIEYIRDISGLLVEKELNYYEFAHLSFQEYLAAVEINERQQEKLLISNIGNSWWSETIRLYAAQSDATTLIRRFSDMQFPSVDVMTLAYDCLEECLRVDDEVRQQLIRRLEEGLESTDPEIFKLVVQVRLTRRLKNLLRIDENLYIDNDSYITCAEYQLFLDETGESRQPKHWQSHKFPSGYAKKTIDGIRWEDVSRFCLWLKLRSEKQGLKSQLSEEVTFYRLPTEEERNQHPINDDQQLKDSGIRLVKWHLSQLYSQLAEYLFNGEWRKADEETVKVMLQVAGRESQGYLGVENLNRFPCQTLQIIDQLWVYTSKGHFGFSVQKIYNRVDIIKFCEQVGWQQEGKWLSYDNLAFKKDSALRHLPTGHFPKSFYILTSVYLKLFYFNNLPNSNFSELKQFCEIKGLSFDNLKDFFENKYFEEKGMSARKINSNIIIKQILEILLRRIETCKLG